VTRTLILSAWEPEIAPLRRLDLSGPALDARAVAVGVGPVEAAVGAARAIAAHGPGRVIFVGTAGAYPRSRATLPIGTAALACDLTCVSTAALRGDGYLPETQVTRTGTSAALQEALGKSVRGGLRSVSVACPLAITRSATLGRQIARATGAGLENLEAFAVARAAAAAGVEFAAVLGVANRVGPSGHREWRAHHLAASRAACRVISAFLRGRTRRV
jgi:nucleoside phosphorylase